MDVLRILRAAPSSWTGRAGILARERSGRKRQRGSPVRGSTVDGVIGCPAAGAGRGGPVCGIGGGAWGGAGVVGEAPGSTDGGEADGNPVRGLTGWLLGSPVRGSMVDGAEVGGPGTDGVSVESAGPDREPGVDVVPGACASAGEAAHTTIPIAARDRQIFIPSSFPTCGQGECRGEGRPVRPLSDFGQ